MKRLMIAVALSAVAALAACEDPRGSDEATETADTPTEMPVAPSAEDAGVPAAAPSETDTPPVDPSTIPPEKRTSDETVAPESETLFY